MTAVTREGDAIRVVSERGVFTAPIVIGAGGHHCPVAKAFGKVSEQRRGRDRPGERDAPAARAPRGAARAAAPVLYVEPDLKGYGWYFPKEDVLNVGIGVVAGPGADLPRRREALIKSLHASGHLPADLPIEPFRGHAYVVRRRAPRRLAGDGFCLVGDAAGLARDLSGEGIGPAIRSGILAAEAVVAHLRRGAPLESYTHAIVRRYGRGEPGWLGRQLGRLPDAVARGDGAGGAGHGRHAASRGPRRNLRDAGGSIVKRGKAEDARAIAHHYDVSNEFYALFLDPLMLYTCAYYRDPDGKLEQAQQDKLDHVCRKLELRAGETLLDIGCGWGGLSIWAARHYGVRAHGVTLSRAQAEYAAERIRKEGLERTCRVDYLDYRDLPAGGRLRQDRGHRRDRARRHPELPGLLRRRARAPEGRRALSQPRHRPRLSLETHEPDRVPHSPRLPER